MHNENLDNISESMLKFLFSIQNIFTERDIFKHLSDKSLKNCCKSSLPNSHIRVILYLARFNSSSISEIAKNLNISKPNMTPIIDKLIDEDLVTRYPDPNDRRILRVDLTAKATDFFNDVRNCAKEIILDKISSLPDDDLDRLENSLIDLIDISQKLLNK